MNLHEYQAKALLSDYGIPVTDGINAETPAEAALAAESLGGGAWAVKAQIHAGLRLKAGGERLVSAPDEVRKAAAALLGSRLVTPRTGPEGKTVKSVYVERAVGYVRRSFFEPFVATLIECGEPLTAARANAAAAHWLATVANVRVHGTTGEVPQRRFEDVERDALLPLPPAYVGTSPREATHPRRAAIVRSREPLQRPLAAYEVFSAGTSP